MKKKKKRKEEEEERKIGRKKRVQACGGDNINPIGKCWLLKKGEKRCSF
jgi:hypothetical protein